MIDISSAIEAILFAAGDSVPVARLALVLGGDGIWYSVIVAEVLALAMSVGSVLWLGPVYGIIPRRSGSRTCGCTSFLPVHRRAK